MPFFPELETMPLETVRAAFLDPPSVRKVEDDYIPFWLEEAAIRLARSGGDGVEFLLEQVRNADEPRTRAILLALSFLEPRAGKSEEGELRRVLLSFLDDSRPSVVAQAVDSIRHRGYDSAMDRIVPLLNHESPYVVGSALRFLGRHDPDKARTILQAALESPDPIIRQNAIDELDDLNCVEALPRIRKLLHDEDADVRSAAKTAVANLQS